MKENNKNVSVIIPTYNRGDVIDRAINSVLEQTYKNYNIIVIDDGSTDDTKIKVNNFDSDKVNYFYQKNSGANAARNRGMKIADGDYYSFLDSDDTFYPDYLNQVVQVLSNASDSCIGAATADITNSNGIDRKSPVPNRELSITDLQFRNPIGGFSSVTFKSSITNEVGYLDEDLPSLQDYDYFLRATKEFTIAGINEPLVRRHKDGLDRISDDIARKKRGHELITEKHGDYLHNRRISSHHIQIGKLLMKKEDKSAAKKEFLSSIISSPRNLSSYFYFISSLLGIRIYNMSINIKNFVKSRVR